MSLTTGNVACGVFVKDTSQTTVLPSGPVKPYAPVDQKAIIADIGRRLANLENAMVLTVPSDRVISAIVLTKDTALITADKIAIVGDVTFQDWTRDVSGQAIGVLDPSITQIRGGVIRTEKVISFDGQSWLDLDATGTTPFVRCRDTVSINANGTFTFGNTSGKQLIWDGSNLSVSSGVLISGRAASTLLSDVDGKLAKAGTDILSGQISFTSSGAFTVGTPTIDGSGNVTGGTGLAVTQKGIVGISSGVTTFAISTTGSATFSGDIVTGGQVLATGVTTSGSYVASMVGGSSSSTNDGIRGISNSAVGVGGVSTNSTGVLGLSQNNHGVEGTSFGSGNGVRGTSVFGVGVYCSSGVGNALEVHGPMTISNSTLVTNLNADKLDGYHAGNSSGQVAISNNTNCSTLYASNSDNARALYSSDFSSHWISPANTQPGTGTGVATSVLTNKPGGNSSNVWLALATEAGTIYIQAWS